MFYGAWKQGYNFFGAISNYYYYSEINYFIENKKKIRILLVLF